jgi:hypothetical protein
VFGISDPMLLKNHSLLGRFLAEGMATGIKCSLFFKVRVERVVLLLTVRGCHIIYVDAVLLYRIICIALFNAP